ncbi:MAG TPA: hypothetical protein VFO40_13790 [Chthoniobacterales bacterium]|nr:hypothetical protein [Chthoniobacterales bacterium]
MKTIPVLLLSFLLSVGFAHLSWAHGGGGGGAGGSGGGGSHGGGNGSSMGAGHGASMSFGHGGHGNTLATRGGHSHSTLSHHGKSQTISKSLARHSRAHRHSTTTTRTAQNEATLPGKKKGFIDGLPPGLELQVDRGKSLPPGWQSKVGPGTVLTDTDTPADQALPPGQEIQADRGQEVTPTINR